jgi:glycosyltransferase involved in cell wall biosynthesis
MKKVFYFGLEPLKARYTYQLSKEWMPATFAPYEKAGKLQFIDVEGEFDPDQQIKVGAVLDAVGRGKFAMSQCSNFLDMLNRDEVSNGDVIFLQDYWHPGIESILYALDLYGINVDIYAMLHAQSVDEYDFTWPMRNWMRGFELGLDKRMTGIFVGSTIHRDQLREAGFEAPIHVVSLPLHHEMTLAKVPYASNFKKENKIVFSSRLDKEKNPFFMLEVAEKFLEQYPGYVWNVTTSGKSFKSMLPGVIEAMEELAARQPRFQLLSNLTKEAYYTELATAKVQFNSSLQDYVSWTVLESTAFGCDVVFPNFRSFPEFIPEEKLYRPFNVQDTLKTLHNAISTLTPNHNYNFAEIADVGRRMEGYIIANGMPQEINVWHELEYCKYLLNKQGYNE